MTFRIEAWFTPQAWISDNAVEVDLPGQNVWDCTDYFLDQDDTWVAGQFRLMATDDWALDGDDVLASDENAPEWVLSWRGPFDIHTRIVTEVGA